MILPVTTRDIDKCAAAYLKAYNCAPWNYRWTYENAKDYLLEYISSTQFVGFAFHEDDIIVGALFAHSKTWWTNRQLMVDEFFIAQENQGIGYGKKLLAHCEEYAVDYKIESIVLMTSRYMPAYEFYDSRGYVTAEQYVFMFKQTKC